MKILCVDDSEVVRNVIEHEVARADFTYLSAENGKQGAAMVKRENPDLIFLDLNMPTMNGLEMLEHLKEEGHEIPDVVMLTTEASLELKKQGKSLGVKAWVVKPLKKGMFQAIVERLQASKKN